MRRVYFAGMGAVSPAGWNAAAMREALDCGQPLPIQTMARPGWEQPLQVRWVPNPTGRLEFQAHPRMRRTSPIAHYTVAAALEAVAGLRGSLGKAGFRLGIVMCLQSGCVQYTNRFYTEVLENPSTASPLLFPETVYSAPASHVAALLGEVECVCTLVGDPSVFLQGIALGAQWLEEERVDFCLVVGAEEAGWTTADAVRHLDRHAIVAEGAGALCLCSDPAWSAGVELTAITDCHTYSANRTRMQAGAAMRGQLGSSTPVELLCDGIGGGSRADAAERAAWSDWDGPRVSPKRILGDALMASSAWQCVAACDALANGRYRAANVSVVGANQQAIGARFVRNPRSAASSRGDG